MKDINGNEFKVGCVLKDSYHCELEVLKIIGDELICMGNVPQQFFVSMLSEARILHYRELKEDKNGKMLREGDTIDMGGKHFLALDFMGAFFWLGEDEYCQSPYCTFVSRPTDAPAKSAEAIKLEQLIKENEEMQAKLKEALKKVKE